jgi:hypothetical protein
VLPAWARARALAYFQLVFMGGQALGALAWGVVADAFGLAAAFLLPAGGLVVVAFVGFLLGPLRSDHDVRHSDLPWPEVPPAAEWPPEAGPVLVTLEWQVPEIEAAEFLGVMRQLGRARRRTGASLWGVFQDADDPELYLETFTVGTWAEHVRQHLERGTVADAALEQRARRHHAGGAPPVVRHLVWAYSVPAALPDLEPDVLPHAHPELGPSAGPAAGDPS